MLTAPESGHRIHGFSGYTRAMQLDSSRVIEILQIRSRLQDGRFRRLIYSKWYMTGFAGAKESG